jgi:hypothetical protein
MMVRLFSILIFLFGGITLPAHGGSHDFKGVSGKSLVLRPLGQPSVVAMSQRSLPDPVESGKTRLQVAPDAAMQASTCIVFLAGLAVVGLAHLQQPDAFPPTRRQQQHVLFQVLFRQIISPNAP